MRTKLEKFTEWLVLNAELHSWDELAIETELLKQMNLWATTGHIRWYEYTWTTTFTIRLEILDAEALVEIEYLTFPHLIPVVADPANLISDYDRAMRGI